MKLSELKHISEEELLATRICDFEFDLKSSKLSRGINDIYFELNSKLINFLPHIWISNDWFSPDGVAGFAIPFYLLLPHLISLEKKHIGFVEGETTHSFKKLLRHETAHALDNAFHLRKNKKRQTLFGLTSKPYPKSYLPNWAPIIMMQKNSFEFLINVLSNIFKITNTNLKHLILF